MLRARIGPVTLGLSLLGVGLALLLDNITNLDALEALYSGWPAILILLGLEVLVKTQLAPRRGEGYAHPSDGRGAQEIHHGQVESEGHPAPEGQQGQEGQQGLEGPAPRPVPARVDAAVPRFDAPSIVLIIIMILVLMMASVFSEVGPGAAFWD